jgi:hypothetical protein
MDSFHRTGSPYRDRWHLLPSRRSFVKRAAASLVVAGVGLPRVSLASMDHSRPGAISSSPVPAWFRRDVQRMARWLPDAVKTLGVDGAYERRWNAFPDDIRAIFRRMSIPPWMIALVPSAPDKQDEIFKQCRFMADLAGDPPTSPVALRAEQLMIFGGSAQLPTPGDRMTGESLGAEGCTAAISKYVLAQLKIDFPRELAGMSDDLANSQSSDEMKDLFEQAKSHGLVEMHNLPFARLQPDDFRPGCVTIAQKPGGTHVFGWTRVPTGWNWYPGDTMAIGNTGLPQYGDHMILAQEYVTRDPAEIAALAHNDHGPINSRNVIYIDGRPDLSDPRTNVYAVQGSRFIVVNLR